MQEIFDVVVIGGGPAGIMCAGTVGARGAKVLLLEKNEELGKKILITGHGRCNVTQAEFDIHKLVKTYGEHGPFLFSSLYRFGPEEVMDFFKTLGVNLKVEDKGRVFPESDEAREIVEALKKYLSNNNVQLAYKTAVKDLQLKKDQSWKIFTAKNEEILAKNVVLACGGLTYPILGATGEALVWAKNLGHKIIPPTPALVPLLIKEAWVRDLQGVSLRGAEVSVWQSGKKIIKNTGDLLFTHFGVSGPAILNLSKIINLARANGEVCLDINLLPYYDEKQLDEYLRDNFRKFGKKSVKNVLNNLLPEKLVLVLLELAEINSEKLACEIVKEERLKLRNLLHNLKLTVIGSLGFDSAMVTSGGVDLKEVNPLTMGSRIQANLYFVGEILDLDGPTGGYNLTIAWSTGHLAGESIVF